MKNLVSILKKDIAKSILIILLILNFGMGSLDVLGEQFAVPAYMKTLIEKFDLVYTFTTNEMVRFIEKQYIKIIEKPGDFYPTDCQYAIDVIWPSIPDSRKTTTLTAKYEFIRCRYDESLLALELETVKLLAYNK